MNRLIYLLAWYFKLFGKSGTHLIPLGSKCPLRIEIVVAFERPLCQCLFESSEEASP